jgi:DNA-binding transcriptional ArsR family regulator
MQVFAALADPTRAKIVETLARRDLTAGEIAARFPVSRPAVSRHLRVLRKARLVRSRGEAQRRVYSLNPEALDDIDRWLARCREMWNQRLDRLDEYLKEMVAQEASRGGKPDEPKA